MPVWNSGRREVHVPQRIILNFQREMHLEKNKSVKIGEAIVGDGHPLYITAEIGINHNGDVDLAKKLISVAKESGCNAVKFQKRTPEICVPEHQKNVFRETPWGYISYLDYRRKVEFGKKDYEEIDRYCSNVGITWFASAWDEPSLDFLESFGVPCHKIPSAHLTNDALLRRTAKTGKVAILSSGMSTMDEVRNALSHFDSSKVIMCQSTSTYPAVDSELNLRVISSFRKNLDCVIGYSGHEVGLATSYAAAVLGAAFIERHVTLDRSMWGTDQAASLEPQGLLRLVRDIRAIELAMGDGEKKVYDSELSIRKKLRGN